MRVPSSGRTLTWLIGALALFAALVSVSEAQTPAKEIFGHKLRPADMTPKAIGNYARGCLAGGVAMPVNGPTWQTMRPSRNRNWGHPNLVSYLSWLAEEAAAKDGWPGLLVGDMSQARGGPMLTGHRSHQVGLDADIWLTPMPDRRLTVKEREETSATEVVFNGPSKVHPNVWTDAHYRLLKRAASHPNVQRLLVHPGIKKALCEAETGDTRWLRKVRPWWGHNYHFHVRLRCPAGVAGCSPQAPPPAGSGCGKSLDYWFTKAPWTSGPAPKKAKGPLTMARLPQACRTVAAASDRDDTLPAIEALAYNAPPPLDPATSNRLAQLRAVLTIDRDLPRPRPLQSIEEVIGQDVLVESSLEEPSSTATNGVYETDDAAGAVAEAASSTGQDTPVPPSPQ